MAMRTLYVSRKLLNTTEFVAWAKSQGFQRTVQPDDLHCTVAFSKDKVDWSKFTPMKGNIRIITHGRKIIPLGDKGAVVLQFKSRLFKERWEDFQLMGCSRDFPEYHSHVTISYQAGNITPLDITPYTGELLFGPEVWAEVVEDWETKITEKAIQ